MKKILYILSLILVIFTISCNKMEKIDIMYAYINNNKLKIELENNSSTKQLVELLKEEDITYIADDYGNFEKVGSINHNIVRNDSYVNAIPGDVILYQGNNICLYYGYNSYNFTKIGHIYNYNEEELREILAASKGEIVVKLSLN